MNGDLLIKFKQDFALFANGSINNTVLIENLSRLIFSIIDEICRDDFHRVVQEIREIYKQKNDPSIMPNREAVKIITLVNYKILELIYENCSLEDKISWEWGEERLRKLNYINQDNWFRDPWSKSIAKTVKNMIFKFVDKNHKYGKIDIKIGEYDDLKTVMESWQSIGIPLNWSDIPKEANIQLQRKKYSDEVIQKVTQILKLSEDQIQMMKNIEQPKTGKNYTREEAKGKLIKRAKRKRMIVDGKHMRDFMMVQFYKKYKNYRCKRNTSNGNSCGNKIELSHIIPLRLGVKLGGIDHYLNYEVLCSYHHKLFEIKQNRIIKTLDDEEKLNHFKDKYPGILAKSLYYIDSY